jgi:hypothetical protein
VKWAALVPELDVSGLSESLRVYTELFGFGVRFARPEQGFVCLALGDAQLMLNELADAKGWPQTGALERPFGRGLNLQIEVGSLDPLLARLAAAAYPLFVAPEENWYRTGDVLSGSREFMVQDPDGYLLRFSEALGERPL